MTRLFFLFKKWRCQTLFIALCVLHTSATNANEISFNPEISARLLDESSQQNVTLGGVFDKPALSFEEVKKAKDALASGDFVVVKEIASNGIRRQNMSFQSHLLYVFALIGNKEISSLRTHLEELAAQSEEFNNTVLFNVARYYFQNEQYFLASNILGQLSTLTVVSEKEKTLMLAQIYEAQRQTDLAIEMYSEYYAKDKQNHQVALSVARLQLVQDRYSEAEQWADKFLSEADSADPDLGPGNFIKAISLTLQGKNKKALRAFQWFDEKGKSDIQIQSFTALNYLLINDLLNAKNIVGEWDNRDLVGLSEPYFIAAIIALKQGDITAAAQFLESINTGQNDPLKYLFTSAVNPEIQQSLLSNAQALMFDLGSQKQNLSQQQLIDLSEIALLFRQGLHNNIILRYSRQQISANPYLAVYIARANWQLGNSNKALQVLDDILTENSDFSSALLEKASINYHLKNYDKAVELYEQVSSRNEENISLKVQLANLYNSSNYPKKAITLYKKLLLLKPSAYLNNQIAATYSTKLNEPANGLEYAMAATNMEPQNLSYIDTLASIQKQLGNYKKAEALYLQILSVSKLNQAPDTFYKIAQIYDAIEQPKTAQVFYELSLNTGHDFEMRSQAKQKLISAF